MKRIALFVATNLAIVAVLSIAARAIGIDEWLTANGSSLGGLLAFAALFGFGGSLLSLALSKWLAKRAMGVHVIDRPSNATEQWLVATVRSQAEAAGIRVGQGLRRLFMTHPPLEERIAALRHSLDA